MIPEDMSAVGLLGLPAGRVHRPLPDLAPHHVEALQARLVRMGVMEKYGVGA